jgi:GTP-binding protein EngB required for normal cell division
MGEAQSKECADGKETDNLSMEDAESDINILRGLAENEGSITITEYINETLNRWKKEQVKIAITGRSATGKSTFINTIRKDRKSF